jgi:hypothetical protein
MNRDSQLPSSQSIYLCISIDCECDKGPRWRSQRPLRFSGVTDGIHCRLAPIFQHYRAKPTYLLSAELLRDDASIEALRAQRGAELGTHLHGEYAEPGAHLPDVTRAFQRDYPEDVERAKLASLTRAFRAAFGRAPRAFRAGRFGIGPRTIPMLEALDYHVDSSVTPSQDWSAAGAPGLEFVGAPSQPYRPDPRVPKAPGASQLWEVPVTIRARVWSRLPVIGTRFDGRWLRPTRGTAAQLIAVARDEIRDARRREPRAIVLNAMFHNVEVIPGASPYAATDAAAQRVLGRLAALLEFARRERIRVVGLSDIPELVS